MRKILKAICSKQLPFWI